MASLMDFDTDVSPNPTAALSPDVAALKYAREQKAIRDAQIQRQATQADLEAKRSALELQQGQKTALAQTAGADAAQWMQRPEYQQDFPHQPQEFRQHMMDAYGDIAPQLPGIVKSTAQSFTGNPEIGIPQPPAGTIETRSVTPAGEVHRSYQYDPSLATQPGAETADPLANLPKAEADMAREIAAYRFPYNALTRMPPAQRLRILNAVSQVQPDFDANQYPTRQAVMKSFGSGQDAANIASANTLIGHLNDFLKAGTALNNKSFTPYNAVANAISKSTGSPTQTDFTTKRDAVATELSKLFKGTGAASDKEIQEWRNNLSENASPDQIRAAAESIMSLMSSRLDALKSKYEQGMGKPMDRDFLNPRSRAILRSNNLAIPESAPAQEEAAAPEANQHQAALEWLQANPQDPRAAAVRAQLQKLGALK